MFSKLKNFDFKLEFYSIFQHLIYTIMPNLVITAVLFISIFIATALKISAQTPEVTINKGIETISILHPSNSEYLKEVAFNLDKPVNEVTQEDFSKRYAETTHTANGVVYYIFNDYKEPYKVILKNGSCAISESIEDLKEYLNGIK